MNERNNGRLKGRVIMLGVTASIAAYKAADLCSRLIKEGADVRVLMTPNATRLIGPVTFEGLTHHPTAVDIFAPNDTWEALLDKVADPADLYIIAPCTADCLARIAAGMANDFVSAAALAATCPILIAPAMATPMWLNIRTQRNAYTLKSDGIHFVGPDEGRLATGRVGPGRMSQPEAIVEETIRILLVNSDLAGKKVLVTAGPTQEALDPVRMLTNRSTGRMGIAIAEAAAARGADVTLVLGPTHLPDPAGVNTIRVTTAEQMRDAALPAFDSADIVIAAAAVSDYRPADVSTQKVKKEEGPASLRLERTPDILKEMGSRRTKEQVLVGFAAETENLAGHTAAKLAAKNLDAVVANDITLPGAGFAVETNAAMWVTATGAEDLGSMSKRKMADAILDRIRALRA